MKRMIDDAYWGGGGVTGYWDMTNPRGMFTLCMQSLNFKNSRKLKNKKFFSSEYYESNLFLLSM